MSLENRIISAFSSDRLFDKNEIGISCGEYQSAEELAVVKFFSNLKISDISVKKFESEYEGDWTSCLCFMRPRAAAHFLGSYLSIALENYHDQPGIALALLTLFDHDGSDYEIKEWIDDVLSELSEAKMSTLYEFVEYFEENHAAGMTVIDFYRLKNYLKSYLIEDK